VSPTETAELVEVTFGSWTWVDLRNHVVGGDRNHPPPARGGAVLGVILGQTQTCPRSIFLTFISRGSGDAAFGYQATAPTCYVEMLLTLHQLGF